MLKVLGIVLLPVIIVILSALSYLSLIFFDHARQTQKDIAGYVDRVYCARLHAAAVVVRSGSGNSL